MSGKTNIEWTEHSWNPIVGCSLASPGCTNCYAMKMAARLEAVGQKHYAGLTKAKLLRAGAVWTGKIARAPDSVLLAPLKRKKPTTYFVSSMGDLVHEDVDDHDINLIFEVMSLCPQHTFQVLTKRSARMRTYFAARATGDPWAEAADAISDMLGWENHAVVLEPEHLPLPNVWLGVSAEDQKRADERIPDLLATPAVVRFVSCEPLLGAVDLRGVWNWCPEHDFSSGFCTQRRHEGVRWIDWVIVGGESGPGARPMHPQWARDIRDQCKEAGVPFFFKQNGEWVSTSEVEGPGEHFHFPDGATVRRVGKKRAGNTLDGRAWLQFPGRERAA